MTQKAVRMKCNIHNTIAVTKKRTSRWSGLRLCT